MSSLITPIWSVLSSGFAVNLCVSSQSLYITVEIQHCARSENVANLNLKFVRAVCSQKQLPYNFRQLQGGNFTSHSSYGVIELDSFSGLAITQEGTNERRYLANLLSKEVKGHQTAVVIDIFFVVTCNTDAHRTVSLSLL